MNLNQFLSKLDKVKKINFSEHTASCPAHDDKNPSLSVTEKDGKILLHCHRGCSPEEIVSAMGLKMKDLYVDEAHKTQNTPLRTHIYRDAEGNTLARKHIYRKPEGKKYALWERLEGGVWHRGLGELKAPLYRLNELKDSELVYIVEGEKDADTKSEAKRS